MGERGGLPGCLRTFLGCSWKSWVQTAHRSRERSVVVPVPAPCQLPGKSAGRISLPEHECQREKSELMGRL